MKNHTLLFFIHQKTSTLTTLNMFYTFAYNATTLLCFTKKSYLSFSNISNHQ